MKKINHIALLVMLPSLAFAQTNETNFAELAHIVWVGICCALIFIMQPGFALLESGLVRAKNTINVVMKNFADVSVGALFFWAIGFGIIFGENATGFFGTNGFFGQDVGADPLEMVFQMLFAATAATIVSGALAERVSFVPYLIGAIFITAVIYPVFASWVWGGDGDQLGWLRALGFQDAAGGTAVHAIGGWCALAGAIVLGPRLGRFGKKDGQVRDVPGHNLPMFATGAFFLWVGWFGFNGGAAKDDLSDLGQILLNTHLSGASACFSAIVVMKLRGMPIIMTRFINGGLGGLVAITAGCNVVEPQFAILIGLISGAIVVFGDTFLHRFRIDDVVGAVPVHAFCGVWGTLALGMFTAGDLFNIDLMVAQMIGVISSFIWAFGAAYVVFKTVDLTMGLRASTFHEQRGLDYTEHNELGYAEFMKVEMHQGNSE